jgi:hypothetical protein
VRIDNEIGGISRNVYVGLHFDLFAEPPRVSSKAAVTRETLLSLISLFYFSQISESSSHMSKPVCTAISQTQTDSIQNP